MAPVKRPQHHMKLYNRRLLCAASGWDTDNRLCLFVYVPFSQRTGATAAVCCIGGAANPKPENSSGGMWRLNAKSAAVASRVILLEIIRSGVRGSHRHRRLRGSSFCLVNKKRELFSFFSQWSDLPEATCIPNPFILLAPL